MPSPRAIAWASVACLSLAQNLCAQDPPFPALQFPRDLWSAAPDPRFGVNVQAIIRGQQAGAEEEEDPIETDRPDFTEASSVVPVGMLQLESGYTFVYDDNERDDVITRTHSGPEMLLRYGLSELFELRFIWNYVWERTEEGGATADQDGAEDLTVGTKVFLLEQDAWIPEAAIILHLTTPTGADAFSNRHVEFETNLLYGWDLPYDFTLGASTGYATATQVSHVVPTALEIEDRHNVFHQSVTLGVPWTDNLRSYIEYFGLYFDGLAADRPENYIDGGFTYLLNNDTQVDLRAGHGLNDSAEDFFAGAGLSLRR